MVKASLEREVSGLTAIGRVTARMLAMNHPARVTVRSAAIAAGLLQP